MDITKIFSKTKNTSCKKLLIASHVVHYVHEGKLYAYAPYAREIEKWAELFPKVTIASPLRTELPPGDTMPFAAKNIRMHPMPETGGLSVCAKLTQVLMLPWLVMRLSMAMYSADAIHVRCPGNIGLLGALLAPLFSKNIVAKYAGQWTGYPGEAATVRLQRKILSSYWWRGPVTVYGEWPGQPNHVVPFFTSVLTVEQQRQALLAAADKSFNETLRLIFVGRLSKAKNVNVLIDGLNVLCSAGRSVSCTIIGDGPERSSLEEQVHILGLSASVTFTGALEFDRVLAYYAKADVLVLASETEGWPKAIAEGMAFGLVCIGSNRGLIPWMLSEGRGVTVPPGDVEALAHALQKIIEKPEQYRAMRHRAAAWAQQYSLEGLRDAIRSLLEERWGVSLPVLPQSTESISRRDAAS